MKIIYIVLFSILSLQVMAEDVIYFNDGTQQKGTVVEVTSTEIKYRKAENPNGPLYAVERSKVQMIEYTNGYKDIITANNSNQNNQSGTSSGGGRTYTTNNNYYNDNPRPRVFINVVPPPPPVYYGGWCRPRYYHPHHYHRGPRCWR